MQFVRRPGFSLIEALVVLAIGGMAMAVIFSIGLKAGDTGFALGRRAMSVADTDVAVMDLRSLIRSIALRPPATINPDYDQRLFGTPQRLEADVVTQRATLCTPTGWSGRLILSIEVEEGRQVLNCQAGSQKRTIMALPPGQEARLSYSVNQINWQDQYQSPEQTINAENFRSQTLWVRLTGGPRLEVIEAAYSSQPGLWIRPSVDF